MFLRAAREHDQEESLMHSSRKPAGGAAGETHETSGELFPDGTALELGRSPRGNKLSLFCWNGSSLTKTQEQLELYVPPRIHRRLARELFLPSRLIRHRQTGRLLSELENLFHDSFRFAGNGGKLLSLLVLASWIPELLPAAACIAVHGPFIEVAALLRLLQCLGRHALLLGQLDQCSLQNLPVEKLRPTLLIAQLAKDPKTTQLMRVSNLPHVFTPHRKGGQDLFCCKVITAQGGATLEGALDVTLLPGQHDSMQSVPDLQAIAEQFQPKLLGYRLASAARKPSAALDPAWVYSPASGCCQALFSAVAGETELAATTKKLLSKEAEYTRANVATELPAILLECALALSHEANKSRVQVKEFCDALNAALEGRGESLRVSAKYVGVLLLRIGLRTREFHGVFVVELFNQQRQQIHETALAWNVPLVRERTIRCSFCEQVWGTRAHADARPVVQ
jgi:hypothetical protein